MKSKKWTACLVEWIAIKTITRWLLGFCVLVASTPVYAVQDSSPSVDEEINEKIDEEKIRAELVELRDRVVKAYESRDLDTLIADLGPNVIITWQNADRNRGPDEFRAFYKKMMEGDSALVTDVQTTFEIDGSAELYGSQSAIACGSIKDNFKLRDGKDFTLDSKWTATLVKFDDDWKVVSYHVSANVFDNPILTVAKTYLMTFAVVGAILGFVLGCLVMWFIIRSTQKQIAAS